MLVSGALEIRLGHGPGAARPPSRARASPAVRQFGATAVRSLLASIAAALDIPVPAGPGDETIFLRVRSQRATAVLRAVADVLAYEGRTDTDLAWVAANLDIAVSQLPADGYEPSAMSS